MLPEEIVEPIVSDLAKIVDIFNEQANLTEDKKIPHNNPVVWSSILHPLKNEDWDGFLAVSIALIKSHPDFVKPNEKEAIERASNVLVDEWNDHPRVLDRKKPYLGPHAKPTRTQSYKSIAWEAMTSIRDIHNRITGWKPNNYKPRPKFSELFDLE